MKRSLNLLDQIILKAEKIDLENKKEAIKKHKASGSVGESWLVHHLGNLRELIILENVDSRDNRSAKEKEQNKLL